MLYHYFDGTALDFGRGYLAVDLFLILSGFILSATYEKDFTNAVRPGEYLQFLRRRIARVYPLYLLTTSAALILIALHLKGMPPQKTSLSTFVISNLLMLQNFGLSPAANAPAWSISAEFGCYLLLPWLTLLLKRTPHSLLLLIVLGMLIVQLLLSEHAALFLSGPSHGPLDVIGPTNLGGVIRCMADFSIGACTFFVRPGLGFCVLSVATLGPCFLFFGNPDVALVALMPATIVLASTNEGPLKILGRHIPYRLGEISYSLYLLHFFFVELRAHVCQWLVTHGVLAGTSLIFAILFSAVSIFLAHHSYKWIEAPCRRWLNAGMRRLGSEAIAQA